MLFPRVVKGSSVYMIPSRWKKKEIFTSKRVASNGSVDWDLTRHQLRDWNPALDYKFLIHWFFDRNEARCLVLYYLPLLFGRFMPYMELKMTTRLEKTMPTAQYLGESHPTPARNMPTML